MHRVRIGLTGLGAVFLVTLIGAAGFSSHRETAVQSPPAQAREEPLAELGVAPGSAESPLKARSAVAAEAENILSPATAEDLARP